MLTYFLFAEAWGWTPNEVDEIEWPTLLALRELLAQYMSERERMLRRESKKLGFE